MKSCQMLMSTMFAHVAIVDVLQQEFVQCFKNHYRKNTFSCHNVLSEMDVRRSVLNCQGIELLRSVETIGAKNSSSILPSRTCIQRHTRKVELVGRILCPV